MVVHILRFVAYFHSLHFQYRSVDRCEYCWLGVILRPEIAKCLHWLMEMWRKYFFGCFFALFFLLSSKRIKIDGSNGKMGHFFVCICQYMRTHTPSAIGNYSNHGQLKRKTSLSSKPECVTYIFRITFFDICCALPLSEKKLPIGCFFLDMIT